MGLFKALFGGNDSEPEKSTADMDDAEFQQWVADQRGTGQRHKELTTQGLSPTEADLRIQNELTAEALRKQSRLEHNKQEVERKHGTDNAQVFDNTSKRGKRLEWVLGDDGYMKQVEVDE